jgi:hypothetical protein
MSGATTPYHLRPHKAVDRKVFADLLRRVERWKPLQHYAYVSMGAYMLEDHKLIHRLFGIEKLIAFDRDAKIVARQTFNKPIASCNCLTSSSGDLIASLESILPKCGISDTTGIICWLDYTDPKQLGQQIHEFQALISKLRPGDIVRVTVNAHPNAYLDGADKRMLLLEERQQEGFNTLCHRIGDFLPNWRHQSMMTAEGLPQMIAEAFGNAALKAIPATLAHCFKPLSIVRYTDVTQMLSMTGALIQNSERSSIESQLDLGTWPFASDTWTSIHHLVVPDLTLRERLYLEREVTLTGREELAKTLGFDEVGKLSLDEFLDSYKKYYRFYPSLFAAEV